MTIARRIARMEGAEERRFRAAAADFATFWRANCADDERQGRNAAALREAGYDAADRAALERLVAAQPPAERTIYRAVERAVCGIVEGADDAATIRAALATLSPWLGCRADDPPALLVRQLQATIAATPL
jgi:hypothetical protein